MSHDLDSSAATGATYDVTPGSFDDPGPHVENDAFSKLIPFLQTCVDSTSLNAFKTCPQYYKYAIVDGWVHPWVNDNLKFGLIYHSATELYERRRSEGHDHNRAVKAAVHHALVETYDFELKRPWASEISEKSRATLVRTIIWYLDHFEGENLETVQLKNGQPAVELSFRFPTGIFSEQEFDCTECGGMGCYYAEDEVGMEIWPPPECQNCKGTGKYREEFQLAGHLDRVVSWDHFLWVTDKKSTRYQLDDRYFLQFSPDNQVSLYSFAGKVVLEEPIEGLIIDACQVLVGGTRFRRRPIPRDESVLAEWYEDLAHWLKYMERCARDRYWPKNETSCGYGNNHCVYRSVCNTSPAGRTDVLTSQYTRRVWDPTKPRGNS